jgi:hypothetical protein
MAALSLSLQLLACWDCGFEYRQGHGCLSLVSVVCCQVEVSATGQSLDQKSPTECGVSECHRGTSTMRRPRSSKFSINRLPSYFSSELHGLSTCECIAKTTLEILIIFPTSAVLSRSIFEHLPETYQHKF